MLILASLHDPFEPLTVSVWINLERQVVVSISAYLLTRRYILTADITIVGMCTPMITLSRFPSRSFQKHGSIATLTWLHSWSGVGCGMKVFDVKFHAAQQICRSVPYCFVVSFRRLRPHSKKRTESNVFPATFPWVAHSTECLVGRSDGTSR